MTEASSKNKTAPIDKKIFWPAIVIVFVGILLMMLFDKESRLIMGKAKTVCTDQFGFVYLWFGVFALLGCLWLGFGKYRNVRLGGAEAKPEFSRWSWIAMFFCSGIGTSLIFWSSIEWTYYYTAPPFGVKPKSPEAADWAAAYGLFHWGPTGWSIYLLCAFPMGYAYYNRKMGSIRLSTACAGVIG